MAASVSSLRWRARVAKEASLIPFDDSGYDELSSSNDTAKPKLLSSKSNNRTRILYATSALAVASSIWSLQTTHSAFIALTATLTVSLSVLVHLQHNILRRQQQESTFSTIPQHQNHPQTRIQSLRLQNERLYRQVLQLEDRQTRLGTIRTELVQRLAADGNPTNNMIPHAVQVTQQFQDMKRKLHQLAWQQVQATILQHCATVTTTTSSSTDAMVEGLMSEWQAILPGMIVINQDFLREIVQTNNNNNNATSVIIPLLQQVARDAQQQQPSQKLFSTSPRGGKFSPARKPIKSLIQINLQPQIVG